MKIFFKTKGKSKVRIASVAYTKEFLPDAVHEATEEEWLIHLKMTGEFELTIEQKESQRSLKMSKPKRIPAIDEDEEPRREIDQDEETI